MNGGSNPWVSAAATEVALHGVVNILVSRRGVLIEKCRRLHDLAGLAVAALSDLVVPPCLL